MKSSNIIARLAWELNIKKSKAKKVFEKTSGSLSRKLTQVILSAS